MASFAVSRTCMHQRTLGFVISSQDLAGAARQAQAGSEAALTADQRHISTVVPKACATHLVVISEQLVKEVCGLCTDQVLVGRRGELVPRLPAMPPHQGLQLGIQLNAILVQVGMQLVRAQKPAA